jgi:hypothetical protein
MQMEPGEYGMTYLLRLVACLFLSVSLNSFAALSIRDLDGDWSNGHEGVYDDVLDITWLADAKLSVSYPFGLSQQFDYNGPSYATGTTWNGANDYINNMNNAGLGFFGLDSWRLPTSGCRDRNDCGDVPTDTVDELGYHHHQNFNANQNSFMIDGENTNNLLHFNNIEAWYWTGQELGYVSAVLINNGRQATALKSHRAHIWPVHDGDIGASPVPLPQGIYLFLSGLVGLGLMRGRND